MIPPARAKTYKTSRKRPHCLYSLALYNKRMHIRKTFAALCASLLAATLLGLGLNWSSWHVISQPDYIKKTLSQSGIYDTIVQNVLQQKEGDLAAAAGL